MNLWVYDSNLVKIGVIEKYRSLIWTNRYYEYGDCEVEAPVTEENIRLLRRGNFLKRDDNDMVCIIRKIEIDTNTESGNYIIATGQDARSILNQRVVLNRAYMTSTYAWQVVTGLIQQAVQQNNDRKIDFMLLNVDQGSLTKRISVDITHAKVFDAVREVLRVLEHGSKFVMENYGGVNKLVFRTYKGRDHTRGQQDLPPVHFSEQLKSVANSQYIESDEDYANSVLIWGDNSDPVNPFVVRIDNGRGLDKFEIFLDKTSMPKKNPGGTTIDDATYTALLKQAGEEELAKHLTTISFAAEVVPSAYEYKKDYDLGDLVTITNSIGYSVDARVIEVIECENENGYTCIPRFEYLRSATFGYVPKAILGANGNLNFVFDEQEYIVGQTYTDNIGTTTITAVYEVPEKISHSRDLPWVGTEENGYRPDITRINFSDSYILYKPKSIRGFLYNLRYVTSVTNLTNLNTEDVTTMYYAFASLGRNASSLTMDVSSLDTSSCTNMSNMFYYTGFGCTTVSIGSIASWNVANVQNFDSFLSHFAYTATAALSFDLADWNTGNATNMRHMFRNCGRNAAQFICNVSRFRTANVTDMSYMFAGAGHAASVWNTYGMHRIGDVWNTSKVTNMEHMFDDIADGVTTLNLDIQGWNVSNVLNMAYMFYSMATTNANITFGDIESWSPIRATDMSYMFAYTGNNNYGTWRLNLSGWDVRAVTNYERFNYASNNHITPPQWAA